MSERRLSPALSPRTIGWRMRALLVAGTLLTTVGTAAAQAPARNAEESLVLPALEDAYVVVDSSKQEDPTGLRDRNFGGLEFTKVWYAFQGEEKLVSLGLYKFDLSQLKGKDLRSAHLQMFATRADLVEPVRLVDVSVAEGDWTEGTVAFNSIPQVQVPPLATTAVYGANVWYSWDISQGITRKAAQGEPLTLAIGLRTLQDKAEEQVVFASREVGRTAPRLVVTFPAAPPAPVTTVTVPNVVLYVVAAALGAAVVAFGVGMLVASQRRQRAAAAAQAVPSGRMLPSPTAVAPAVESHPDDLGRDWLARVQQDLAERADEPVGAGVGSGNAPADTQSAPTTRGARRRS